VVRRRYRHPPNTNVITLRNADDPEQLALAWEREVVPELVRRAESIKIVLAGKPSVETVFKMWLLQRDDFWLFVHGTADPALFAARKRKLDEAEASMAALVEEIELHNAQVRGKVN
jgi:hypothetical protein